MIVKIGNLFDSNCSVVVNTVNCVGVMGKGIALEFKKRFPYMFNDYVLRCKAGELKPGSPYVYEDLLGTKILVFPTKDHWRSPSRLSYIVDGLDWFVEHYKEYDIESIAFPPLGCGNGGLSWSVVGPVMYQKLCALPIQIEIYAPFGTPQNEVTVDFLSKRIGNLDVKGCNLSAMNPNWNLILKVIQELNSRRYSLKVGRTIYQKLCYVLTRNGVNTGFHFTRGTYGPYSSDVKNSILILANSNLIIEEQLGKMISMRVSDGFKFDQSAFTSEDMLAVKKTVDLFSRIKSTEQAELIATVLYSYDELAQHQSTVTDKDIYDDVLIWKPYWKTEKEYELCDAINNLAMLSLIRIVHTDKVLDTLLV